MTIDNFLSFLQQMLTILDPSDEKSVDMVRSIILDLKILSEHNSKAFGSATCDIIRRTNIIFDQLVDHRDEFAGVRGDYAGNKSKRDRLLMSLRPHC